MARPSSMQPLPREMVRGRTASRPAGHQRGAVCHGRRPGPGLCGLHRQRRRGRRHLPEPSRTALRSESRRVHADNDTPDLHPYVEITDTNTVVVTWQGYRGDGYVTSGASGLGDGWQPETVVDEADGQAERRAKPQPRPRVEPRPTLSRTSGRCSRESTVNETSGRRVFGRHRLFLHRMVLIRKRSSPSAPRSCLLLPL